MSTERMVRNYVLLARSCNHLMLLSRREGAIYGSRQFSNMRDTYMEYARRERDFDDMLQVMGVKRLTATPVTFDEMWEEKK